MSRLHLTRCFQSVTSRPKDERQRRTTPDRCAFVLTSVGDDRCPPSSHDPCLCPRVPCILRQYVLYVRVQLCGGHRVYIFDILASVHLAVYPSSLYKYEQTSRSDVVGRKDKVYDTSPITIDTANMSIPLLTRWTDFATAYCRTSSPSSRTLRMYNRANARYE